MSRITLHTEPHPTGARYARVEYTPDSEGNPRVAAFALEQGVLVETVEWVDANTPDWEWGGKVDSRLASDPYLCALVDTVLRGDARHGDVEPTDSIAARLKLATTDVREAVALILDAAVNNANDADLPGMALALGAILSVEEVETEVVIAHARNDINR